MPKHWLQVKGDPMVREFLFAQTRVESLFDTQFEQVERIVKDLLMRKGVFHLKVHYSSSQLSCWFSDDVYRYRVYVREEVLDPGFLGQFREQTIEHLRPVLDDADVDRILAEFRRLRMTDESIYLRNGSINRVSGMIGMTFSCDGTHYIDHRTFFDRLESFGRDVAPAALA